ncbi:ABC transporter permease [Desulfallas thermosapovorans]|uniref:Transport permease protein n=1 Tax=Desulfallas thermosapovorans DSM 6562 TaxID=1121431 RepID=A0A5S4ZVT1_9FIRM|nr:ABC transporter permease [Desulfallas thermosapovorans]TYO96885.1 lipopolysaccharide transport system permease protein/teichoic acid transport system permease protein [Desulfallas thermosapovorans DSM 6562]
MKQYLRGLIRRKDLLIYLVISGLKAQHRNSFLGYFWWLLDPLLGVLVYYFLVVIVLGRGGENYGAFLVIGMVAWRWLSSTVNSSSKSITNQSGIITQVYLPKIIFPLCSSMTQLINFSFGLVVVAIFLLFFKIVPGAEILWLPFVMLIQQLFLLAISLVLGYVSVFIRDIENVLGHFIRVWFYSSPVIWEAGRLPEEYSWILSINPVTAFLSSYRNIFMYNSNPEFLHLFIIGLVSLISIVFMLYFYSRNEHKIIKVL